MSEILLLFESFVVVGGRTLLHGTALALVTWLICATVLRKARPALHAALWTVVLFKFLVPPILPGEMALSGLMGSLVRGSLGVGTASSLLVLPAGTGSAGTSAGMEPQWPGPVDGGGHNPHHVAGLALHFPHFHECGATR